ncbi:MAG: DUF3829 domain-containing protein [Brevundimonas sp.]|nr:DUF3829 domain-containing protein [Brevundimonas sp.]
MRALALATASVLTLGLAACGDGAGKEGGAASVAEAAGSTATQEKFNHYVEGFNKLIDDSWGVSNNFRSYQQLDIPNKSASDSIYFPENITTLEGAIEALKEGRALNGGNQATAADAAVDKLLPRLEALLTQWKTLDPYYESRRYREDGLAQGKAADAGLKSAYEAALAGIEEFDTALTQYLRARDEAQLAEYRAAGHGELASLMDAMQKADHFSDSVIEGNKAEADRQLPALEAAVAEVRKAEGTLAADDGNKTEFKLIADYLESMIGDYRDYKQSDSDSDREDVVDNYNRAVGQMGDVEHPAS